VERRHRRSANSGNRSIRGLGYNRIQQPKLAGNIYHDGQRELPYVNPNADTHSYPDTYTYTDTDTYTYTDTHSDTDTNSNTDANSNTNANPDADTYTDTYRYTDSNCHSHGNCYADSYGYADTWTDYSLSTTTDDRSYQGSQHTVQFHSTSKRH
jgi:hypothetical protein